jgi:hypothetical protein
MPVFGWFLEQEKRNLQWLIAAFLDDVAQASGLGKLEYDETRDTFRPVGNVNVKREA